MERNATTIEATNNGIILAVADTNINHTRINKTFPNKLKQKQKIQSANNRRAEGEFYIQDTKLRHCHYNYATNDRSLEDNYFMDLKVINFGFFVGQ